MLATNGKNIVITGASRGIGKAVAEVFASEGNTLILCSKNEVTLYNTMAELQTKYPTSTIKAKAADLSVKEKTIEFGNWVNSQVDAVDILINNAGNFLPGSVYNEPDGTLEEMIAIVQRLPSYKNSFACYDEKEERPYF
jgi:short-subunit dehydrogenase